MDTTATAWRLAPYKQADCQWICTVLLVINTAIGLSAAQKALRNYYGVDYLPNPYSRPQGSLLDGVDPDVTFSFTPPSFLDNFPTVFPESEEYFYNPQDYLQQYKPRNYENPWKPNRDNKKPKDTSEGRGRDFSRNFHPPGRPTFRHPSSSRDANPHSDLIPGGLNPRGRLNNNNNGQSFDVKLKKTIQVGRGPTNLWSRPRSRTPEPPATLPPTTEAPRFRHTPSGYPIRTPSIDVEGYGGITRPQPLLPRPKVTDPREKPSFSFTPSIEENPLNGQQVNFTNHQRDKHTDILTYDYRLFGKDPSINVYKVKGGETPSQGVDISSHGRKPISKEGKTSGDDTMTPVLTPASVLPTFQPPRGSSRGRQDGRVVKGEELFPRLFTDHPGRDANDDLWPGPITPNSGDEVYFTQTRPSTDPNTDQPLNNADTLPSSRGISKDLAGSSYGGRTISLAASVTYDDGTESTTSSMSDTKLSAGGIVKITNQPPRVSKTDSDNDIVTETTTPSPITVSTTSYSDTTLEASVRLPGIAIATGPRTNPTLENSFTSASIPDRNNVPFRVNGVTVPVSFDYNPELANREASGSENVDTRRVPSRIPSTPRSNQPPVTRGPRVKLTAGVLAGILIAALVFLGFLIGTSVYAFHQWKFGKHVKKSEKRYPAYSSDPLDESFAGNAYSGNTYVHNNIYLPTPQNTEEMTSVDSDSFMTSIEAVASQSYASDDARNTKV